MAGNPILEPRLQDYTATWQGTGEATGYSASNARLFGQPRRLERSTNTAANSGLSCVMLGTTAAVKSVTLFLCNFPTVTIKQGSAFNAGTTLVSAASVPFSTWPLTSQRNKHFDLTGNVATGGTISILPSGTPDNGATYWQMGKVAILLAADPLPDDAIEPPYKWTVREAETRLSFLSGGEDVQSDGPIHLERDVGRSDWFKTDVIRAGLSLVIAAGKTAPLLFFENLDDASHVALVRRTNDPEFSEDVVTFGMTLTLRDIV